MIAGILNRFGKIGVIVGFAIGTIALTFVTNRKYVTNNLFKRNSDCFYWLIINT
ncbi:MAG: hypothetical protein IKP28_01590 [Clostridia bacterium]|nr:hypothetical protein [Clostridia bacterium]